MKGYMEEFRRARDRKSYKKREETNPERQREFSNRKYFEDSEFNQQVENAWRFITEYIDKHGFSPSMRDIGKAIGLEAACARRRVERLVEMGHITKAKEISRSIVLINRPGELIGGD